MWIIAFMLHFSTMDCVQGENSCGRKWCNKISKEMWAIIVYVRSKEAKYNSYVDIDLLFIKDLFRFLMMAMFASIILNISKYYGVFVSCDRLVINCRYNKATALGELQGHPSARHLPEPDWYNSEVSTCRTTWIRNGVDCPGQRRLSFEEWWFLLLRHFEQQYFTSLARTQTLWTRTEEQESAREASEEDEEARQLSFFDCGNK